MNVLCRHLITPLACLMAVTVAAAEPRLPVIAPRPPSACGCQASSAPLLPIPDPIGGYDENVKCKDKDGNEIDTKSCGEGETAHCYQCDVSPLDGIPDNCNGQCAKDGGPGTDECFQCKRNGSEYNNACRDIKPPGACAQEVYQFFKPDTAVGIPWTNAPVPRNLYGLTKTKWELTSRIGLCYKQDECGWKPGYRVCSISMKFTFLIVIDARLDAEVRLVESCRLLGVAGVYGHEQMHVLNKIEKTKAFKASAEAALYKADCFTYTPGDPASRTAAILAATQQMKTIRDEVLDAWKREIHFPGQKHRFPHPVNGECYTPLNDDFPIATP